MKQLLALDFDGVICDSRLETFFLSLQTYLGLHPDSSLAQLSINQKGIQGEMSQSLTQDPTYKEFQRLGPLGNRAEDFGVIWAAIEKGVKISDQAQYDSFYDTFSTDWRTQYHHAIYEGRTHLRDTAPTKWAGWHTLYQPLIDALRDHRNNWTYAIATAKDRASVEFLLNHWKIEDLFAPELIVDKETGVQKTAHLTHLRQKTGLGFEAISFIDDKVNHLIQVAPLGVSCILAAWGTESFTEAQAARDKGFVVAQLSAIDFL